MEFCLTGKRILITGGTGTWGREFIRQLLTRRGQNKVTILSRSEYRQLQVRQLFGASKEVTYVVADVRDTNRVHAVTRGVDVIIHLAAMKHVSMVEENLNEALAINTIATGNIIEAALANSVERVLYVSSDKAADPLNFYGITKLAAERLVIAANQNSRNSRFITFRAGNVIGSSGSVVELFQNELVHHNMVSLTDPSMTRFFFGCEEAVLLALNTLERGEGGEIFIPVMKSATLGLLVEVMIKHLGRSDTVTRHIGVRPGEKTAELLISRNEAVRTKRIGSMWVVLPFAAATSQYKQYGSAPTVEFDEYRSDTAPQFSADELESLLRREGFLPQTSTLLKSGPKVLGFSTSQCISKKRNVLGKVGMYLSKVAGNIASYMADDSSEEARSSPVYTSRNLGVVDRGTTRPPGSVAVDQWQSTASELPNRR
jgi:UDP-N-acetylglucosamine 4,6-dehydratase